MANQTLFIAGRDKHVVRLTSVDWALLDLPRLRGPARVAFQVLRDGQETVMPRVQLLATAQELFFEIEFDMEHLAYAYAFEYARPGMVGRGGTGMSVRIDGQHRFLRAGLGVCEITSRTFNDDQLVEKQERDLRGVGEFDTDDLGPLRISRRRRRTRLLDELASLIDFLEQHHGIHDITLRGSNAPPDVLTLVRTYEAGGASAEWAREAIADLGEGIQSQLIELLEDREERDHHPAIARILMLIMPGDISREAVRHLSARERDVTSKELYLSLLSGTYEDEDEDPTDGSIDDEIDVDQINVAEDADIFGSDDDEEDGDEADMSVDELLHERPDRPQALKPSRRKDKGPDTMPNPFVE